jgi:hypothetical protein
LNDTYSISSVVRTIAARDVGVPGSVGPSSPQEIATNEAMARHTTRRRAGDIKADPFVEASATTSVTGQKREDTPKTSVSQ